jgi:molybdopterin molybdotransferase
MISVDEALNIIRSQIPPPQSWRVPLEQAAGCLLAEPVRPDMPLPPFDRATMDGYAFRSADVTAPKATLTVIGESAAGSGFAGAVGPGQAVQIMTGAPVPQGADCVQMIEKTELRGEIVCVLEPVGQGRNIAKAGSEVGPQDSLPAYRHIGAAEMAVLASFGAGSIPVFRRPSVALLVTGDELVEVVDRPAPGQIRNSNAYSLRALIRSCGVEPLDLGIVRDDPRILLARLEEALTCDMVVASGGVSAGKYDLVAPALEKAGARIHFSRVSIRPGKPITFATRGKTIFFGLPGNPVSSFVTFEVFVRAAILQFSGRVSELIAFSARLRSDAPNPGPRPCYAPARTRWTEQGWETQVLPSRGSADIFRFSAADSLVLLPADSLSRAGEQRTVRLLHDYWERVTAL